MEFVPLQNHDFFFSILIFSLKLKQSSRIVKKKKKQNVGVTSISGDGRFGICARKKRSSGKILCACQKNLRDAFGQRRR